MFRLSHSTSRYDFNLSSSGRSSSNKLHRKSLAYLGHEYPYAIKMKHFKSSTSGNGSSFETDDHLSVQSSTTMYPHHSSTTSLNHITSKSHDFELRKRESDHQTKKYRFFPKRKVKDNGVKLLPHTPTQDEQHHHHQQQPYSSSALMRSKSSSHFFGQTIDEVMKRSNQQLPAVIQQLLEILYYKGPETTGIFRKVANTRAVRESVEKIERNIPLQEDDLHPILAAGIFKVDFIIIHSFVLTSLFVCLFSIFYECYPNPCLVPYSMIIGKNVFVYRSCKNE